MAKGISSAERAPATGADFPRAPIGIGNTAEALFSAAAEQRAAQTATETSFDAGDPTASLGGACRSESGRTSLVEQLIRAPGVPVRLGRYDVVRCIGSGGMGVVYEAIDRDAGRRVALKMLRRASSTGLARFKNEFRSVADLVHDNLIALYELASADDEWFFTMEYVEGARFADYARPGPAATPVARRRADDLGETMPVLDVAPSSSSFSSSFSSAPASSISAFRGRDVAAGIASPSTFDEARLRSALLGLATGVRFLHAAGKLHRDLNSANVLVTRSGRVVVLDFGLVSDEARAIADASFEGLSGTPGYMAPEQAAGRPATTASDWYAVGVMLYEALTGQLPFTGTRYGVLQAKQASDPRPPSALVPGVPADLDELCVALLRRAPSARPSGEAVLASLVSLGAPTTRREFPAATEVRSAGALALERSSLVGGAAQFVGRHAELAMLADACCSVLAGRAVTVHVHGRAGVGKTALVRRFLEQEKVRGAAVVLEGRCYERESLPCKALDGIIDALSRHLRKLPPDEFRVVLGPEVHDIAGVFPVFHEVAARDDSPPRSMLPRDPDEARRRALRGLKALLRRMGTTGRVVIAIDDLHWGDADSARMLGELCDAPDGPSLLLIAMYRSDDETPSPLLYELARRRARATPRGDVRSLAVEPLSPNEATALALVRLERDNGAARAAAITIGTESEGSPHLIEELARGAVRGGDLDAPDSEPVSVARAVRERLATLPEEARALLEVIAVAGRGVEVGVAGTAAGIGTNAHAALTLLRAERLVRTTGFRDADTVDAYHARIRGAVLMHIAPDTLRAHHLRLARALGPRAAPEILAQHFFVGGALDEAGFQSASAGDRAVQSLSFDRAAELYHRARAWSSRPPSEGRALGLKEADALARAGRASDAAPLYLEFSGVDLRVNAGTSATATAGDSLDLQRCAAEQMLLAGNLGGGVGALRPVLAAYGLEYPETAARALFVVAFRLGVLRVRGTHFTDLGQNATPPAVRARLRACWSASRGLAAFDPVRSGGFIVKALLLALSVGDARGTAAGLALTGCLLVLDGRPDHAARGTAMVAEGELLAERTGHPYVRALTIACSGHTELFAGRFRTALDRLDRAAALFGAGCAGAGWELAATRRASFRALSSLGEIKERSRRSRAWLHEARAGARFDAIEASIHAAFAALATGDSATARAELHAAITRRAEGAPGAPHAIALAAQVGCDLYDRRPMDALACLAAALPALEASGMLRAPPLRIELGLVQGATAVACASLGRERAKFLRAAEGQAVALDAEHRPDATAGAALVRAGIARVKNELAVSLRHLHAAAEGYDRVEMRLHAACARRRVGRLIGGSVGDAMVAAADALFHEQDVRDPERWTVMYSGLG